MKKHLIVIGTAVLLLAVGFSGCQDTTQLSIVYFNVEPSMINKEETANLSWNVTGATTVSIDNNIGDVGLSGTRIVSPIQNTTYVLTASNSNTSKTATTQIIVLDKSESEDNDDDDLVINIPPTEPTIDGPQEGTKGTEYSYSFRSTDPNNDAIKYIVNWGDGEITTTDFLPNGTATILIYSWISAGNYILSVQADDNKTVSSTTQTTILIDAHLVDAGILGFELPSEQVENGDTFWVTVYLDPPSGKSISGWKISVSYDPAILEAQYVVTGDSTVWPEGMFDLGVIDNGDITYVQAWTVGVYPNYKTDLCTIRFTALKVGTSALSFTYQKITDETVTVITVPSHDNVIVIN